jgi:DNA-binding LytR/AlgR family response regulator
MPEISGLDFLKTLKSYPEIILTTAYREYALEGYEHNVTDYLLKPIEFTRFLKAINKVKDGTKKRLVTGVENAENKSLGYVHLKYNKKTYKIATDNILYIEGENEYVNYFLKNGEKLLIYGTLKDIETELSISGFCRTHRSFIVNLNEIEYVEGNRLFIQDKSIPISDTYKKSFLAKWK